MFQKLEKINNRPKPFEFYTASDLWTDAYTSEKMLAFHLNGDGDISSRNAQFIKRSVAWIASTFNVGTGKKIADFGCGPGLYATGLAEKGATVTGIDFSKRSIQHASKVATRKGLSVRYIHQDYLQFKTQERFHLILMIMCDFCALSPVQRKKMLSKFFDFLEPGGSVLLDVYSMRAFENRKERALYEANLLDGFWSPKRYYGFLNTFKYAQDNVVLDKYTIVEADRERTVYNWLQYFEPKTIEKEFVESGFAVEKFYADVAGTPYDSEANEFAVVAKKL